LPATQTRPFARYSLAALGLVILTVAVIGLGAAARPSPQSNKDAETCGTCHDDLVKAFAARPHAALKDKTCTACHGTAQKHIDEEGKGGVFAFRSTDRPSEKSAKCLTCHQKDNPEFASSPHAKGSLDCTTCHTVHGTIANSALLKTDVNKNCSLCHTDIFAQFQLNERHRLQEGVMTCTTCHNPHESATRNRLGGFKQEACLKCHTDKGGPFIYEHLSSRVEGCTICHEAHGSPNRHLLTHQSVADLCFSCHAGAPAWHANFTPSGTNCVTCHMTIHGSNLSNRFLK
jgi:DmsE family decaheme c-type cytochrome